MASVYCRGRKVRDRGSQERGARGEGGDEKNYCKDCTQARMAMFGRSRLKNVKTHLQSCIFFSEPLARENK